LVVVLLVLEWKDPWRRIKVVTSDGIFWVIFDGEDFEEWRSDERSGG
jgi:hypothetical protein